MIDRERMRVRIPNFALRKVIEDITERSILAEARADKLEREITKLRKKLDTAVLEGKRSQNVDAWALEQAEKLKDKPSTSDDTARRAAHLRRKFFEKQKDLKCLDAKDAKTSQSSRHLRPEGEATPRDKRMSLSSGSPGTSAVVAATANAARARSRARSADSRPGTRGRSQHRSGS